MDGKLAPKYTFSISKPSFGSGKKGSKKGSIMGRNLKKELDDSDYKDDVSEDTEVKDEDEEIRDDDFDEKKVSEDVGTFRDDGVKVTDVVDHDKVKEVPFSENVILNPGVKGVSEIRNESSSVRGMEEVGLCMEKPEPTNVPLWVKILNVPFEAWNVHGISRIASRIWNPIIMDRITTYMCDRAYGRASFARVLIEVDATQELADSVERFVIVSWSVPKGMDNISKVNDDWQEVKKPNRNGASNNYGQQSFGYGIGNSKGGNSNRGRGGMSGKGGFYQITSMKGASKKFVPVKNVQRVDEVRVMNEKGGDTLRIRGKILRHSNVSKVVNDGAEKQCAMIMKKEGITRNQDFWKKAKVERFLYTKQELTDEVKSTWTDGMIEKYECLVGEKVNYMVMESFEEGTIEYMEEEVAEDISGNAKFMRKDEISNVVEVNGAEMQGNIASVSSIV
uniref:Uncharacterized protein n=1 Tax=Tanacetum cinerariifolium TaxID=118510 RepID=A0A6L2KX09_TANCI|nr:hypothetical protein [Tanacetum cinerariifolium]